VDTAGAARCALLHCPDTERDSGGDIAAEDLFDVSLLDKVYVEGPDLRA